MNRVFVSYSRRNKAFAIRLARDLDDAGLDVWFDLRQIHGGEFWEDEIYNGLQRSEFLVLCLSPHSVTSPWVQKEVLTAQEQGKPIFPVVLPHSADPTGTEEPLTPAERFKQVQATVNQTDKLQWLPKIQWVDFTIGYEQAFPQLLRSLPGSRRLSAFDRFDPASVPNPFKGLEAFQQRDAAFFFGRENLVRKALERMRRTRFLAVVGASGSGKSSLVRAGVVPQLRQGAIQGSEEWPILIFTPGANPIQALMTRLGPLLSTYDGETTLQEMREALDHPERVIAYVEDALRDAPASARLLIIIDQFEEVFTRTGLNEARFFLELLTTAATDPASRAQLILTMRADFFDQLGSYPDLAELFEQENLLIVTEMTSANLLRVIQGPVEAVGLRYEDGLVDRILDAVRRQPGSLPLLQYALRELFKRRDGIQLTNAAYDEIGGVQQALAQHAETIYQQLDQAQQDLMRRILLKLVEVGESGEATRRKIARQDIYFRDVPDETVDQLLDLLTSPDARLLIASREVGGDERHAPTTWVEVSHEALIQRWERFRTWVKSSAEDLIYDSELRKAASDWLASGRDEAYLLVGKRLTRAEVWLETADPNEQQREFIQASMDAHERRQEAERLRQARELALQAKATRRLRLFAAVLLLAFVGAGVFGVVIFQNNQTLEATQGELQVALNEAEALAVSVNAESSFQSGDLDLALALALAANQTGVDLPRARRTLADIGLGPGTRLRVPLAIADASADTPQAAQDTQGAQDNDLSSVNVRGLTYIDGGNRALVAFEDGRLLAWDVATGAYAGLVADFDAPLLAMHHDSARERLLIGLEGSPDYAEVRIFDLTRRTEINALDVGDADVNVVRPWTRERILAGDSAGRVLMWEASYLVSGPFLARENEVQSAVQSLAVSPDGRYLAVGYRNGRIFVLDDSKGQFIRELSGGEASEGATAFASSVRALAFGPDQRTLVGGDAGGRLALWRVDADADVVPSQFSAELNQPVEDVAFIPGANQFLAVTNEVINTDAGLSAGALRIWDAATFGVLTRFNFDTGVLALAPSASGEALVTAMADDALRFWSLQEDVQRSRISVANYSEGTVTTAAFSPDAERALTGMRDGSVMLWDLTTGQPSATLPGVHAGQVTSAAFSSDGRYVATGSADTQIVLLEVRALETGLRLVEVARRDDHPGIVFSLAFVPGQTALVSGGADGNLGLWTLNGTTLTGSLRAGHEANITALSVSGDGQRVLSGDGRGRLLLWERASGASVGDFTLPGANGVRSLALNADGSLALTGAQDGSLLLWDLSEEAVLQAFEGHTSQIRGVAFAGADEVFSVANDGTLRLWDVAEGAELSRYGVQDSEGGLVSVRAFDLSANGRRAMIALGDNTLGVWETFPGQANLVSWVRDERYVRDLTCNERLDFGLVEGDADSLRIGSRRFFEGEAGLAVYDAPTTRGTVLQRLASGASLRLIADPITGRDGGIWWTVCTGQDVSGYVLLRDFTATPASLTPTPGG